MRVSVYGIAVLAPCFVAAEYNKISPIALCTHGSCSATDVKLDFPVTAPETYNWGVTAVLPTAIASPKVEVRVVISHPVKCVPPYCGDVGFGYGTSSACGDAKPVPVGVGAKSNQSPIVCTGCEVELTFPSCANGGWAQGTALKIDGELKWPGSSFGKFMIAGTDVLNATVTVRDSAGKEVVAFRWLADPTMGPPAPTPPAPSPPAPSPPPPTSKYACLHNKCVTSSTGISKAACEAGCGSKLQSPFGVY